MSDLKPATQIEVQDWMREEATRFVMSVLNAGADVQALFVGGCVRNAVLGEPVSDIDIATRHNPGDVVRLFDKTPCKTIPTGIEHGTITVVYGDSKFEITTLRSDVSTDGRHAEIAYSQDWVEDARRRDFTMNTLLMDEAGRIYDVLGLGLSDARVRHVKFVGEPAQRIKEDYLRALRYFRFVATYGQGQFDDEALKACAAAAHNIEKLSRERITQELSKILCAPGAVLAVKSMFSAGILRLIDFFDGFYDYFEDFCGFQGRFCAVSLSSRLYMLLCGDFSRLALLEAVFVLSRALRLEMKALEAVMALGPLMDQADVKRAVYWHGREAVIQGVLVAHARQGGGVECAALAEAIDIARHWAIPVFPVRGDDLMQQGFKTGPALGVELKRQERKWLEEHLLASGA